MLMLFVFHLCSRGRFLFFGLDMCGEFIVTGTHWAAFLGKLSRTWPCHLVERMVFIKFVLIVIVHVQMVVFVQVVMILLSNTKVLEVEQPAIFLHICPSRRALAHLLGIW